MFREAKRRSRYLVAYLVANISSAMEYRWSFISQILFMFLNNLMLLFFWWILFRHVDDLNGWELSHLFLLYAIAAGSYSCQALLFGGSFGLSRMIAEGQLDYYLALPKSPLFHILISRSLPAAWGDLLFSVVIYYVGVGGEIGSLAWLPLFLFCGGLVMTFFSVVVHSLSFWLGNSTGLANQLYEAILTFSLYPEVVFSGGVRVLLYTIIPAAFVSYLPVRIITQAQSALAVYLLVAAGVLGLIARLVFYKGLRRYESGNLVVIQL